MGLTLQFMSHNATGLRKERWLGDDYIVCTVNMIVSGVLEGSQGPLYYPPDEIQLSTNDWNGIPVVLNHPELDGVKISARSPGVLEAHLLGWVFNAQYMPDTETLSGEAWMNQRRLAEFDELLGDNVSIYQRLERGEGVELSTGLFTQNVDGPGKTPKGIVYDNVARNYKPDHLAILPDKVGACPLNAGCGMFASNESNVPNDPKLITNSTEVTAMDKTKLVKWLATNCDCWKGDETTLNGLSEAKLKALKKAAINGTLTKLALTNGKNTPGIILFNARKLSTNAGEAGTDVAPGVSIQDLADFLGVTTDPAADPIGYTSELKTKLTDLLAKLTDAADPEDVKDKGADEGGEMAGTVMEKPKEEPTGNKNKGDGKVVTLNELLAQNPALAGQWNQMVKNNARLQSIETAQKAALVSQVVQAYATNEHHAAAIKPIYDSMTLEALQTLAAGIPQQGQGQVLGNNAPVFPSFVGMPGGYVPQQVVANDADDVYPEPWSHSAK